MNDCSAFDFTGAGVSSEVVKFAYKKGFPDQARAFGQVPGFLRGRSRFERSIDEHERRFENHGVIVKNRRKKERAGFQVLC